MSENQEYCDREAIRNSLLARQLEYCVIIDEFRVQISFKPVNQITHKNI